MAGIYPSNGVVAAGTVNGVNVETVNCVNSLFYSVSRCQPRFDPAAMNAMISELLNVVSSSGRAYNCNRLDNLSRAIQALLGVKEAEVGVTIFPGQIVEANDGTLMWNCSGVDITPATVDQLSPTALAAIGLCYLSAFISVSSIATTDSFGNAVAIGDKVLITVNGNTLLMSTNLSIVSNEDYLTLRSSTGDNVQIPKATEAASGLMPALSGDDEQYLGGDGDWHNLPTSGGGDSDIWPTGFIRLFILKTPGANSPAMAGSASPTGLDYVVPAGQTHVWVSTPVYDGTASEWVTPISTIHAVTAGDVLSFSSPLVGAGVNPATFTINSVAQGGGISGNIMGAHRGASAAAGEIVHANAVTLNAPGNSGAEIGGFVFIRPIN